MVIYILKSHDNHSLQPLKQPSYEEKSKYQSPFIVNFLHLRATVFALSLWNLFIEGPVTGSKGRCGEHRGQNESV